MDPATVIATGCERLGCQETQRITAFAPRRRFVLDAQRSGSAETTDQAARRGKRRSAIPLNEAAVAASRENETFIDWP